MKIFRLLIAVLLFMTLSNISLAQQDTIYWSPCYNLKYQDFKGMPDSSTIQWANSDIHITFNYKIVDEQLQFKVKCFFLTKTSWAKNNFSVLMEHEQTHFNIAKLFALKLEQKFRSCRVTKFIELDLDKIYAETVKEEYEMHDLFDKIEKENPNTAVPQQKFEAGVKKQLPKCIEKG